VVIDGPQRPALVANPNPLARVNSGWQAVNDRTARTLTGFGRSLADLGHLAHLARQ
jgi:hypothetical protein